MESVASQLRRLPIAIGLVALFCLSLAQGGEPTGKPWIDMDYGPYLTASLEVTPGNIANKGIAIRLDRGDGGVAAGNRFVLFDTDTMRYAAGWAGDGFINWENIAFDGKHVVHARIVGDLVFENPDAPGWANAQGTFADARLVGRDKHRYGPLPSDWADWKGLYTYGPDVLLAYRVGKTDVLEMPAIEKAGQHEVFTRTLNIGPRSRDLIVQLAAGQDGHLNTRASAIGQPIGQLATVQLDRSKRPREEQEPYHFRGRLLVAAVIGGPDALQWVPNDQGAIRLRIPAGESPCRLKLVVTRSVAPDRLPSLAEQLAQLPDPELLAPRTRGGPRHWSQSVTTQAETYGPTDGPYVIQQLTVPSDNPYRAWMRLGGFDFFSDATQAAVCTWQGDVWTVAGVGKDPGELRWTRIAAGMFQPLGLKIVDDVIYVTCRDQITVLRDLNGDGETDFYQNFNNDAQVTEHFHEFAMDLQTDAEGNFYYAKAARHARDALVPQHGTLIKVSKDGSRSEIIASGFRAPNGVCVNPDGSFFVSDQEGHWTPKNRINLIKPGGFYGNMMGWQEGRSPQDFEQPVCWIHNEVDRSPAEQLWVTSENWGPVQGKLLNLSYGTGQIHLVLMQRVGEVVQGGIVRMPIEAFPTGVMRGRFHPTDGQLYTCGLFGWSSNQTAPGGFYRVKYTGKPLYMPIDLAVSSVGVRIRFTDPLDPKSASDPGNYAVTRWNYRRSANYGSDDFRVSNRRRTGRDRMRVQSVKLSDDAKSIVLQLPDMKPVMQMDIRMRIQSADGHPVTHRIHHTVHVVPSEDAS